MIHQIGFLKKSRSSDHLFVLKCIVEKYLKSGYKWLFTCFINFRKAFNKIIYVGIMFNLQFCNINSNFYNILKSITIDYVFKWVTKLQIFFRSE